MWGSFEMWMGLFGIVWDWDVGIVWDCLGLGCEDWDVRIGG